MDLTFIIGDRNRPKGHALLYFRSRENRQLLATYIIVLPISMDIGKYLPPLLASQMGSIRTGDVNSFAAPPVPEQVESIAKLERLAKLRDDDLIDGGDISQSDIGMTLQEATEASQRYAQMYLDFASTAEPVAEIPERPSNPVDVQRMVYDLLSDRDRLAELSKLVGTLRFATERGDKSMAADADISLQALQSLLPEHYWVSRLRVAVKDVSDAGAMLARLYVERCYKLLNQEFAAVRDLERQITEFETKRRR